jgi:hypothetical protein
MLDHVETGSIRAKIACGKLGITIYFVYPRMGGSSLSYIGPGEVDLGVYGESFCTWHEKPVAVAAKNKDQGRERRADTRTKGANGGSKWVDDGTVLVFPSALHSLTRVVEATLRVAGGTMTRNAATARDTGNAVVDDALLWLWEGSGITLHGIPRECRSGAQ